MQCCLILSFSQLAIKYLAKAGYGQGFVQDPETQGEWKPDMVPVLMSYVRKTDNK